MFAVIVPVRMCGGCRKDDEIECGCYGNCSNCRTEVDRGKDGWPCMKCKKWYCNKCKYISKCDDCKKY